MKHLIEYNYQSIVKRGLITPTTTKRAFVSKMEEEISELMEAVEDGTQEQINEELADVVLTALNMARHFSIDIDTEMQNKVIKNFIRL